MVKVWVYSGGGEAEYRGLMPFLRTHFPHLDFERQLPARPGARPKSQYRHRPESVPIKSTPGYPSEFGTTGSSLTTRMRDRLKKSTSQGERCDVIFTLDDLDCRDEHKVREIIQGIVERTPGLSPQPTVIVGFAAPELEAWLIADWDHCFGSDRTFRANSHQVKKSLLDRYPRLLEAPEAFSAYDKSKKTCREKLSETLIQAWAGYVAFKKSMHTPSLLQSCQVERIAAKCPIFRTWSTALREWDRRVEG